jgi:hypothetical protein
VDTHTPQLLFFQFPKTLPLPRQADADADTNMNMSAKSMGDNRKRRLGSIHGCGLKELPGGFMGKILVFKSGKVKMTLGDVLFDVSSKNHRLLHGAFSFFFPFRMCSILTNYTGFSWLELHLSSGSCSDQYQGEALLRHRGYWKACNHNT